MKNIKIKPIIVFILCYVVTFGLLYGTVSLVEGTTSILKWDHDSRVATVVGGSFLSIFSAFFFSTIYSKRFKNEN